MLQDKTQVLNRLENSNLTCKINSTFGQNIKNPYLAQLKVFQERLKNPKLKCRSVLMRRKLVDLDNNKENFDKQIKKFQEQDCIKQVNKILKKQNQAFSILHFRTIGDDLDEKQKQQKVVTRFKMKINDLKLMKMVFNNFEDRSNNSLNFLRLTSQNNLSGTTSAIESQRKKCFSTKSNTPSDIIERRKYNFDIKNSKLRQQSQKQRVPLNFINYKKSKFIRFNKQNK